MLIAERFFKVKTSGTGNAKFQADMGTHEPYPSRVAVDYPTMSAAAPPHSWSDGRKNRIWPCSIAN